MGGDYRAYIGRGWSATGAHAPNYNSRSIGICLIGDWSSKHKILLKFLVRIIALR